MRLAPLTIKTTIQDTQRFLGNSDYVVSSEAITEYLKSYISMKPKTYNRNLTSLRRFVKGYLKKPRLISSFKMAPVDEMPQIRVPSRKQVKLGFEAQTSTRAKAVYLFTATSGLRKAEILGLTKDKVRFKTRAIIPQHFSRKKRSGITFYSEEAEKWLARYFRDRKDSDPRVFVISDRKWREIWGRASQASNTSITAQVLRAWFATELGELGVPDRYVDIFCGRAPRSVLAKHYTGKGVERLKRIYDKAGLRILS